MTSGTYENPDYSLLGEDHVRRYRETNGEVGYWWNGAPTLLLTTTGRRSGKARTSPLIFARDGDDYLVVGSVGGRPNNPNWYHNLLADPRARIQVRGDVFDVTGRVADDVEKPRLWGIVNETWPNYDRYQERTDRVIPVIVLSPVDSTVG